MSFTIGKCKLFRIKHTTLLESETFLRNNHKIEFFVFKENAHFLVEKNTPLVLIPSVARKFTFLKLITPAQEI